MPRQLPARDYHAIKASFRDLIDLCGGVNRAAAITRGSASRLSEAMSPNCADRFPALDQIADLECECGDPAVTRQLADMAGFDLSARDQPRETRSFTAILADVVQESAAVASDALHAMKDGEITPDDTAALRDPIRKAIEALRALDATLSPPRKPHAVQA